MPARITELGLLPHDASHNRGTAHVIRDVLSSYHEWFLWAGLTAEYGVGMPTYTVRTPPGQLDDVTRPALARAITGAHTAATGAPGFFAQVGFEELSAGRHFVGGVPVADDFVFVHGQIRSGRKPEQKRALIEALVAAVTDTVGVPRSAVWVYLVDLPPANMLEFGHVLPEPGGEDAWLASLDTVDREHLESLAVEAQILQLTGRETPGFNRLR